MINEQLIVDNIWVAEWQAKVFYNKFEDILNCEIDDLKQEGITAMIISAKNFDESKNTKFSTFVKSNVYKRMLNYLRDRNFMIKPSRNKKIDTVLSYDANTMFKKDQKEIKESYINHIVDTKDYSFIKMELEDYIENNFDEKEKIVFYGYFNEGLKQKELCKKMGCKQANVSKIYRKMLFKLSNEFDYMKCLN